MPVLSAGPKAPSGWLTSKVRIPNHKSWLDKEGAKYDAPFGAPYARRDETDTACLARAYRKSIDFC